ncbi:MAG: sulfite exporter TauE/SafE family protein [Melioribacteraceae bacterium]|nr:sulfite exporter TauE/SafE family protein [Melioribacteraceae bacterium]WKZ70951.1 MAG: sulfite exporter TauE/SafE family protein [Melioribacteraceae bacterium]
MEILGYIGAILMGLTLGLIGGGGSILTVPILVYLLQVDPVPATAYSLFIVGLTALVGAATFIKRKEISYLTAVVFSVPAFIAVFITRKFIVPAIPEVIVSFGTFAFTKDLFIMLLFALLMVAAAVSMIRKRKFSVDEDELVFNYPLILIEGFIVGILTGLVGAGGGFLIIPALVILAKLPMKMAVGTSLLIIAVKSLIGFIGDIGTNLIVDWGFVTLFSSLAVIGIFVGSYLSKFISNEKLKPAFGWFVLVMGFYIIGKEFYTSL